MKRQTLSKLALLKLTLADIALAGAIAAAGVYLVASTRSSAPGALVEITGAAGGPIEIGLAETRTVEVMGPRGKTVISVHDGCAEFVSSPCPNKICLRRGRIRQAGEWIACVPNRVFAIIKGRRAYDGITP
mgnify:CR=1 FL=1